MNLTEALLELKAEKQKYFEDSEKYAKEIKKLAKTLLGGEVRVYLFGSALKTNSPRDIDIALVSELMPEGQIERARIEAKLRERIGFIAPFEFHLLTPREFEWYLRFIDKKIEIKP